MTTQMEKQEFIIYKMMYPGLYILAGAPKIGKSWLALDLCMSIANGEQFLKHDTNIGQVLYLSLEDNLLRLQNRIYELTDEPCENLNFAIEAKSIGNGLVEELEMSKKELPNLKIIVIDTLQKIRSTTDVNYGSDYKELSVLKALADKMRIAILVVHHTRKCYDSDPFNMISSSTGISGSVDGIMVLIEEKRGSRKAKLHCAGRDIENLELSLEFKKYRWKVVDDVPERKHDLFSFAVHDLMVEEKRFTGSATELCKLMHRRFGREYSPNWIMEYEKEQEEIRKALPELKIRIEKLKEKYNSADKFINVIRKYTIIDKLNASILNELIDKIVVHHKEKSEDGSTYQQIEIFYRFVECCIDFFSPY